jgi:hypothetical protein
LNLNGLVPLHQLHGGTGKITVDEGGSLLGLVAARQGQDAAAPFAVLRHHGFFRLQQLAVFGAGLVIDVVIVHLLVKALVGIRQVLFRRCFLFGAIGQHMAQGIGPDVGHGTQVLCITRRLGSVSLCT